MLLNLPSPSASEELQGIEHPAPALPTDASEKEKAGDAPDDDENTTAPPGACSDDENPQDEEDQDGAVDDEPEDAPSDVDADLLEMKTLRTTTSTHDDWLHRGPFLHDMPFHTYAEYIDRIRKPRAPPPEGRVFLFEPHYALARTYCQRIKTPARIPVLEALKFVPPGAGTEEENAIYKHIVGSLTRCTCPGGCADPMLFKPFLDLSGSAEQPARWRFRPAWKARRAELEILAQRGEAKTERARRLPCIHDTTLVRGWAPPAAAPSDHASMAPAPLIRAMLAQLSAQRFQVIWPDAFCSLWAFLDVANTHPDQLTLAEFSAIRIRRLVQNLDMMAIARTVRLTEEGKANDAVQENDDGLMRSNPAQRMQTEFMGGEHDDGAEEEIADEEMFQNSPATSARLTLEAAQKLLQREEEIAATTKPGRHRDADMQMKSFAQTFAPWLARTMPKLPDEYTHASPRLLGANAKQALAHQQAVRTAMKKDQEDLQADISGAADEENLEAKLAALQNLHDEEKEATCKILPLTELMQGPQHVATRIREEEAAQGRVLNGEQTLLFALWVHDMQQAWVRRPNPEEPYLALDEWIFDIVIDGGGGCGKSMLINYFFVPLCRAFFGSAAQAAGGAAQPACNLRGVVLAAPTNKAARGIHAKTLHSILGFTPDSSLRTSALALTTQKRVKIERVWLPAGAFLADEFSMLPGAMNHAAALLATYAREVKFRLRREDYAMRMQSFGRMALKAWLGDHLQLPPVPKKNSLFAPLEGTSQEHRVGASIFRNAHYVFQLREMMRFKDPTLLRILQTMRTLGGALLTNKDWEALRDTEFKQAGSAAQPAPGRGWYHTCYVWSVIAMVSFMEACESARQAKETLIYVQAVDVMRNFSPPSPTVSQELYRAFLQVPSLTKTKRLPGICLLHIGMEVRLTTTLEQPYAVQDATGTVLEIQWAEHDAAAHRYLRSAEKPPELLLDQLPLAVLVRLHGCKHVFLPCGPCSQCTAFDTSCRDCLAKRKELEGVFAVQPLPRT